MTLYMQTTQINVNKTIGQIQGELAAHGATAILIEYEDQEPIAVSFKVKVGGHEIPFRLPCRWMAIYEMMREERVRIKNLKAFQIQTKRIAWRQIYRWVQAQMALVETEMVDIQEVFLPYLQTGINRTLYHEIQDRGFKLLEDKTNG